MQFSYIIRHPISLLFLGFSLNQTKTISNILQLCFLETSAKWDQITYKCTKLQPVQNCSRNYEKPQRPPSQSNGTLCTHSGSRIDFHLPTTKYMITHFSCFWNDRSLHLKTSTVDVDIDVFRKKLPKTILKLKDIWTRKEVDRHLSCSSTLACDVAWHNL